MKSSVLFICIAGLWLATPAFAKVDGQMAPGSLGAEICLVDNLAVQENFRAALVKQINTRGYSTRFVQQMEEVIGEMLAKMLPPR